MLKEQKSSTQHISADDESVTSHHHSDKLGVACAVGCAVQCGGVPLLNATLPSVGRFAEIAHNEPLRWGLTVAAGVGAYALAHAGVRERSIVYPGVAVGGMAAIIAGNIVHTDGHSEHHHDEASVHSTHQHGTESFSIAEDQHLLTFEREESMPSLSLESLGGQNLEDLPLLAQIHITQRLHEQGVHDHCPSDHGAPSNSSASSEGHSFIAVDGSVKSHDHCHSESHGWAGEILCLAGGLALGAAHIKRMFGAKARSD